MAYLKHLIIDIECYNEGDGPEGLILRTQYDVTIGIDEFIDKVISNGEMPADAFLVTDNIYAKLKAFTYGIGFSFYAREGADQAQFNDALYCIEALKEMEDETLERMYERAASIPWTILKTDRCVVREITVDDVEELYEIYSDPVTKQYIDDLYEEYEQEVQFTRNYIANQYRFYEYGLWVVFHKESGKLIGRAGIFDRDNQEETELGFVFDRKFWGKGYAYEVLSGIIDYADRELGIKTLVAHVMEANYRSKQLLQKLGFVRHGDATIDGKDYETMIHYNS